MDRREFIKAGAGAAALAGLAACAPKGARGGDTATNTEAGTGEMLQNYPGVGALGYGCMRWPMTKDSDGNEVIDQEAVNELVDKAIAHGVNYFDTSPVYLRGESERATAIALNRHPREKWLLATKLSNFSDASYSNSVLMYRRSLEIFNTDHIDYYLLHSIKNAEDFKERFEDTGIMDFLLGEREAGRIRKLGFSIHSQQPGFDSMMEVHSKYHWDFVQIQMNYSDWKHAGRDVDAEYMYERLTELDIPIVLMEPLLGGRLATLPAPITDMLKAEQPDKSVASWAFRFVGSFPQIMCVLSGMTRMEHLKDNLETYLDFEPLSDEEFRLLEEVAIRMNEYPLVPCTDCKYCMPCPYGIDIPGVFSFYNTGVRDATFVVSPEQKDYAKARRKYLMEYNKALPTIRQADHCIGCGQCLVACPQRIDIPSQLQRIDRYIEALKQEKL